MKKIVKGVMSGALVSMIALSTAACGGGGMGGGSVKVDKNRTQLYVFNFDGGFGSEWLAQAIEEFEEKYETVSLEEGKTGLQIIPNNTKTGRQGAAVLHNVDEIYFTESITYYQSINDGAFLDLTDVITKTNPYDNKTIESKLTDEQKAFYAYTNKDGSTSYYGIPHYSGSFGLVYDIDLFDLRGYYLKDGYSTEDALEDRFIYEDTDVKTAGPNGVKGDSDDGLPATYEEFYMLCDYIASEGNTPIGWSGEHYQEYLSLLYNQVVANQEGLTQSKMAYTMSGTATTLGTVDANGNFVKDETATTITPENAYELYRQEGKHEALKFLETIMRTGKYHTDSAYTGSVSHLRAQNDFLWSGKDGVTKPIAMLADGIWWQSEATETFNAMAGRNANWSKENRNFGWMPLPRTADKVGEKNVYVDHLYSMAFIKANIAAYKIPVAVDFIQFVNSDKMLVKFSQITNTPKALNYEMNGDDLSGMTSFGRAVLEFKQNADVLYPVSVEPKYLNNESTFRPSAMYQAKVGSSTEGRPSTTFYTKSSVNAVTYFNGMYDFYKASWKNLK